VTVPPCSATALRRMGFAQSLHCTIPISDVLFRGSAPKIFMSRADSHDVGGGKPDKGTDGEEGGGVGKLSKERGVGDGDCLSLSFSVIVVGRGGVKERRCVTRDA